MEVDELRRRLSLLEHERPGVMTLRDKDTGEALARCTPGTVMELLIKVLCDDPAEVGHAHWLWQYLECAAPLAEAGPVFESLRRLAQGIGGKSVQEIACEHLQESELVLERRRGRQA